MPSGDVFAQNAAITCTESAANTLTYQQLQTGAALFERRALLIHRLEYYMAPAIVNYILDASDSIVFGLSTNNTMTVPTQQDPNVFDYHRLMLFENGTPADSHLIWTPWISDLTTLPGGGLLCPAFPVYLFVQGASLASACAVTCRFQFTAKVLKPEEYIELVEASRVIT